MVNLIQLDYGLFLAFPYYFPPLQKTKLMLTIR